jgi:malonate decarboxylase beta subunit
MGPRLARHHFQLRCALVLDASELDASDKHVIWGLMGGEQRYATGFVDALVEDDAKQLEQAIQELAARGVPARHRSERVEEYRRRLAQIDPAAPPDGPA